MRHGNRLAQATHTRQFAGTPYDRKGVGAIKLAGLDRCACVVRTGAHIRRFLSFGLREMASQGVWEPDMHRIGPKPVVCLSCVDISHIP